MYITRTLTTALHANVEDGVRVQIYLLECQMCKDQRVNSMEYRRHLVVPSINTDTLLFRDNNLEESKNRKLFIAARITSWKLNALHNYMAACGVFPAIFSIEFIV